jgi:hypothetical protein
MIKTGAASDNPQTERRAIPRPVLWLILFVLSPLVLLIVLACAVYALLLHIALWLVWGASGRNVLFVYSNSPVWQDYVEENILPRLPHSALVLNWSERRMWKRWTLGYLTFRFFGGSREFNPLAVIVRPLKWGKCFRFWKPFRDFKHGNVEALAKVENEFFDCLSRIASRRTI